MNAIINPTTTAEAGSDQVPDAAGGSISGPFRPPTPQPTPKDRPASHELERIAYSLAVTEQITALEARFDQWTVLYGPMVRTSIARLSISQA